MWTYLLIWQSLFSMEMKTDDTYGTTIIYDYYFRKQGLDQNRFCCELSMDKVNPAFRCNISHERFPWLRQLNWSNLLKTEQN